MRRESREADRIYVVMDTGRGGSTGMCIGFGIFVRVERANPERFDEQSSRSNSYRGETLLALHSDRIQRRDRDLGSGEMPSDAMVFLFKMFW